MTRASTCKRCLVAFEQPRIQGRPVEFCGAKCKYEARREAMNRVTRKRYNALREAGVDPVVAQPASCSKWRFEALLREIELDREVTVDAAE